MVAVARSQQAANLAVVMRVSGAASSIAAKACRMCCLRLSGAVESMSGMRSRGVREILDANQGRRRAQCGGVGLTSIANLGANTFVGENLQQRGVGDSPINDMCAGDAALYGIQSAPGFRQHAAVNDT